MPEQDGDAAAGEVHQQPGLSGLEFQDMFKDLEEIQKKLMAGDLAGASRPRKGSAGPVGDDGRSEPGGGQAGMSPWTGCRARCPVSRVNWIRFWRAERDLEGDGED